MTDLPRHPCEWPHGALAAIARILDYEHRSRGLDVGVGVDPMAGRGRIVTTPTRTPWSWAGCELEAEWAAAEDRIEHAEATEWLSGLRYVPDAIACSVPYGNRAADQYLPPSSDTSVRMTYATSLGRKLTPGSAASLVWGARYRLAMGDVLRAICNVRAPLVVVEAANPLLGGQVADVVGWTAGRLREGGYRVRRRVWRTRQRRFTRTRADDVLLICRLP